jgi:integrase
VRLVMSEPTHSRLLSESERSVSGVSTFAREAWRPAVGRAGLDGFAFHGLRHSFVAILVAAGCNVREVSEWAGHNSVAFTLTRYGGLFEDGSNLAVDRLDALMQGLQAAGPVVELRRD